MRNSIPTLITRQELADSLGVCRHTIREYEKRGYVTPLRFSKRTIRYAMPEVDRLMKRLNGGAA